MAFNGDGSVNDAARVDWAERIALGASLACMVHCLALPLLIALLPALSSILAVPEGFHVWMLALAVPMASTALIYGRRRHGHTTPLVIGGIGLLLLAAGAFAFGETAWATTVTVAGSLALAAAHIANWRLRHACC